MRGAPLYNAFSSMIRMTEFTKHGFSGACPYLSQEIIDLHAFENVIFPRHLHNRFLYRERPLMTTMRIFLK